MSASNEQSIESVMSELSDIDRLLTEDTSGERAKAMVAYFEQAATASEERVASLPIDDAKRVLAKHLVEGFRASARVIRHVWETLHTVSLPA